MDKSEHPDDWETVPNSCGLLKRFLLPGGSYIYAAFDWEPARWGKHGVKIGERWRMVNAFHVPKGGR